MSWCRRFSYSIHESVTSFIRGKVLNPSEVSVKDTILVRFHLIIQGKLPHFKRLNFYYYFINTVIVGFALMVFTFKQSDYLRTV